MGCMDRITPPFFQPTVGNQLQDHLPQSWLHDGLCRRQGRQLLFDHFAHTSQLDTTPYAPCDFSYFPRCAVLYVLPILIGCWLVLAIRCCAVVPGLGLQDVHLADAQLKLGDLEKSCELHKELDLMHPDKGSKACGGRLKVTRPHANATHCRALISLHREGRSSGPCS